MRADASRTHTPTPHGIPRVRERAAARVHPNASDTVFKSATQTPPTACRWMAGAHHKRMSSLLNFQHLALP